MPNLRSRSHTGLAHVLKQNDVYRGYHIPKGTYVMPNVYAMLHDPEVYPDPMRFYPERYDTTRDNVNVDPRGPVFGYGRRSANSVQ